MPLQFCKCSSESRTVTWNTASPAKVTCNQCGKPMRLPRPWTLTESELRRMPDVIGKHASGCPEGKKTTKRTRKAVR